MRAKKLQRGFKSERDMAFQWAAEHRRAKKLQRGFKSERDMAFQGRVVSWRAAAQELDINRPLEQEATK